MRVQKAAGRIRAILKAKRYAIVAVPETEEVSRRQGMNIVTIAPRTVIMPSGCPGLKALYLKAGLTIAAEVEISQLVNGAGGLACATGILARAV